jgi:TRAP-type C4-dicarboxylate transport system permease large subunit
MISVIVPVGLLLGIILIKKIPYIGGEIRIGLIVSALAALILGGITSPVEWLKALIAGIDKLSWVMALALFGSIYAESQVELGTIKTVLNSLRAKFGRSPRGLIVTIMVVLVIAGSLLGDAIASATVIGVLVIGSMAEMELKPEQISATIVMGASLGSIMPPITQAFFLSSSLMGLRSPDPVINIGYFTILLGLIICSIYVSKYFVRINSLPENLIPKKSSIQIIAEGWKTLIPLIILIVIIVLRSGFKIELLDLLNPIFNPIKTIPILKGLDFPVVKAIIIVTIISYLFSPVHKNGLSIIARGVKNVKVSLGIQACAGFMIGAFYAGGQIAAVQAFAQNLSSNMLKLGGSAALSLIGMLTGSQTTAQTSIFTFFGPALETIGVNPVKAALAGAHLAMSGQGLPPADLTTFVVAGMVGGILGVKVDPVRSMLYSTVMCVYFLIVGILFLYI